jgi:hypothetical protein
MKTIVACKDNRLGSSMIPDQLKLHNTELFPCLKEEPTMIQNLVAQGKSASRIQKELAAFQTYCLVEQEQEKLGTSMCIFKNTTTWLQHCKKFIWPIRLRKEVDWPELGWELLSSWPTVPKEFIWDALYSYVDLYLKDRCQFLKVRLPYLKFFMDEYRRDWYLQPSSLRESLSHFSNPVNV